MNQSFFEQRVQECLDLRQDPLDCPEVLEYIEQHPEALDALVHLRAVGLHSTWPIAAEPVKRQWWEPVLLATVAAVLVLSIVMQKPNDSEHLQVVESTPPMLLAKAPTPKLLSVRVTSSTSSSSKEVVHHTTDSSARVLSVSSRTTQNIH